MRIGIITFHRAHNYGAVLQCYALQQHLILCGYDAEVIDYNNKDLWAYYDWRDREYENRIKDNPIKIPIRIYKYLKSRKHQILRYKKFVYFQEHILNLSAKETIFTSPYDLILIGSDQVWNTTITHGFDSYYWGTFNKPKTTKVATFAASLRSFWREEQLKDIYNALKRLDGISVREESTKKYVTGLFPDLNISCILDPVFLLSSEQWRAMAKVPNISTPYVFFYQAETSEHVYKTAVEIAAQQQLPLFVLSANQWAVNSPECHSASPQEFVGWILNASLVITSSFHALAFSIIFGKDFYGIKLNTGQDDRLTNIVSLFGLEDRLIDNASQCKKNNRFSPNKEIEQIKKEANEYISRIIVN